MDVWGARMQGRKKRRRRARQLHRQAGRSNAGGPAILAVQELGVQLAEGAVRGLSVF